MEIPTFGIREKNKLYENRYAAYIIIFSSDVKRIMLVQAPNGAFFLPGGEIEAGETKIEAIHREVMEELGFTVEIDVFLGEADEYFYSRHRETYFHNPGYFYVAKTWEKKGLPLEDTNQIAWFEIDEAIDRLKRGSHKWAVHEWKKSL